jgi:hypothetical protein
MRQNIEFNTNSETKVLVDRLDELSFSIPIDPRSEDRSYIEMVRSSPPGEMIVMVDNVTYTFKDSSDKQDWIQENSEKEDRRREQNLREMNNISDLEPLERIKKERDDFLDKLSDGSLKTFSADYFSSDDDNPLGIGSSMFIDDKDTLRYIVKYVVSADEEGNLFRSSQNVVYEEMIKLIPVQTENFIKLIQENIQSATERLDGEKINSIASSINENIHMLEATIDILEKGNNEDNKDYDPRIVI